MYHGRSPLHNIHLVNRPVAFLHGTDDPVVPAEQSRKCHASLKARGVATMLREFPGEAHGFKKADTVALCMDMAYCFLCRAIGIKPSVDIEVGGQRGISKYRESCFGGPLLGVLASKFEGPFSRGFWSEENFHKKIGQKTSF